MAAPAGQIGVQGDDDRKIVETTEHPWRSIGRVNNAGRSFCTGVLIGERRLLTAAHCLRSHVPGRAWAPPSAIHFLAGYNRGDYVAHAQGVAITIAPAPPGDSGLRHDWAVVTLAKPLGKDLGFLPVERFDFERWRADRSAKRTYAQAGYSHDHSHVLTRHDGCSLEGFVKDRSVFAHRCDATMGDSGSPILVRRAGKYRVIGLHVAVSRPGNLGLAIAGATILDGMPTVSRLLPILTGR